jgi:N-dimethylarginine dimethylaminohydrolase
LVDKVKQSPHSTGEPDVGTLAHLLDLDAKMYGSEDKAIAMNAALSLIPELPLGNIFFARDQANVLFDTCFLSNMKYPIRQPEVAVIKAALEKMGYKKFVQITDGTFEGGDGMVMKGAAYIGSGMRTSPAAVAQIAGCLQDQGKLTYMVTIPDQGGWHENMEVMHLDTFGMPVSQSHYYGCIPVLQQCTTKNMLSGEDETFMAHLMGKGFNICGIPVDEQKNYAANMMGVKPGVVVAPSDYNPETTASLINDGITVHSAKLIHLTQAVGATHCMGLQTQKV